jgi:uncharacterized protein (DUF433 family)
MEGGRDMANIETDSDIDWIACELIERIPGKVSGRPIVRGTRIVPDREQLRSWRQPRRDTRGFPTLSIAQIKRLIEFAHAQRGQPTL